MTHEQPSWHRDDGWRSESIGLRRSASYDYLPYAEGIVSMQSNLIKELNWPTDHHHFYAGPDANLRSPYVSPFWVKNVQGLPPLLMVYLLCA